MKFGIKASAEQFGPRELLDIVIHAEAAGMDTAMISDHFQPWRHTGGHAPFSVAWLAAAGQRTERITLGTSVLTPHFRYNPAVIAQAFATLGCLSPGRMILGVGTGEAMNEIAAGWRGAQPFTDENAEEGAEDDRDWPPFKERFSRLREAVDLIRALWSGELQSFAGKHFTTRGAGVFDLPAEPLPIYIAAGGPVVARYAGRAGDGFICTSGKGMDLYRGRLQPAVDDGARASGRAPEEVDRMIEIKLSYHPDEDAALGNLRFWAPLSLSAETKHSFAEVADMERAADAVPLAEVARRWIVGSDPEAILAAVAEYVEAGFTHLVFHSPGPDQHEFLDLFSRDLAPRLAELSD